MKGAILTLLMMFLLLVPSFAVERIDFNGSVQITGKSKFIPLEEVADQKIRNSEKSTIHFNDVVGLKPKELIVGKVSRTYKNAVVTSKRLVNSKKTIKTRGHPSMYYKNKIG